MRMHSILTTSFAAMLFALSAGAQDITVPPWASYVRSLPPYRPHGQVSGTVRSWGHGFLKVMMRDWEQGFHRFQPRVVFRDELASSATAMAGLYTSRADIGVLAREILPMEVAAYEKVTDQRIFPVTVLTGSYGDPDKIMALGVFVNRSNPLAKLDFEQLDAIFGAQHLRGEPGNIRTWGQLGLVGPWTNRPIHPYSGPATEMPAFFFSQIVMRGSVLWNCELKQFGDEPLPGERHIDGYQRVINALARDPDGIAVSGAGYRDPHVKLLAIAIKSPGPYVAPTRESVADLRYPLSRPVRFYINDGPKLSPSPAALEFLRYVLSRDGQEQVLREGDFLPITPGVAQSQLEKLANSR